MVDVALAALIHDESQGFGHDWRLAARLAGRELRGGLKGFRVFLACLALGVAAVAGVGTLAAAIAESLREKAQVLLGGDLEIVVSAYALPPPVRAEIERESNAVSRARELRALAYGVQSDQRTLIELKAVDSSYPLYGAIDLDPPQTLAQALAPRGGKHGALAERSLLTRLNITVGDSVRIGDSEVEVRGAIVREPDRIATIFSLGPRLMVADAALDESGLIREGSLVRYKYRARLDDGSRAANMASRLKAEHPAETWQIRGTSESQPGVAGFVDRFGVFLTLVGVTALLVGGIGVGNAVANYLAGKTTTIAVLKCLGAPGGLIVRLYFLQVFALATMGVGIGIAFGAMTPWIANIGLGDSLPVPATLGFYWRPALQAAAFGWLVALVFALWPLALAREVPVSGLFRHLIQPQRSRPRARYLFLLAAATVALTLLAIFGTGQPMIARWFVLGAVGALLAFRLLATGVVAVIASLRKPSQPILRLALANLSRPSSPIAAVIVSLGAGLTVLITVALIQANLGRQIAERVPQDAPAFFFIDIQPDQAAAFEAAVAAVPGTGAVERVPMLRGRLTKINDLPVEEVKVAPEVQWVTRNELGFTYAAVQPKRAQITAGSWWPENYVGPPIISLDADIARGLGIGIGDRMTYSILGREITAGVYNLRRIDWMDLGINFVTVFAPGAIEGAPHTHLATARATAAAEEPLFRAVTERFPNVSPLRVRDISDRIASFLNEIAAGIRAAASLAVAAGVLVLAGAVAAGHRRRVYDAVILKVLGATRANLALGYVIEFVLLGTVTAAIAVGTGTIGAWIIVTQVMRSEWNFVPAAALLTALGGVVLTALLGFLGTWWALGQKPARILRAE
ncbi:MAG: FtsX-like permease family protein [Alphaproteobacteria bacterium]|nr:FtsX-like permease family protein [Alphaproteobacteria bacterium]